MSPMSAGSIAKTWGGSLITPKISDAIFQQAELRLRPQPLTKSRELVDTFFQHHELIEEQRRGNQPGLLVAGIKKDIVLTNRLLERANRVAIYGWHQADGKPIQPLYVGHRDTYVDYSHGVRLMSQELIVDGHLRKLAEIIRDPALSLLLTDEGPLDERVSRSSP
jgi:hypothetical protein